MNDKAKKVVSNVKALTDQEFDVVRTEFYKYCEELGFYLNLGECISNDGYYIFPFQREIAENILQSMFQQKTKQIGISITRQMGKTEFVSLSLSFCFQNFYKFMGRPINICVIAPERSTATRVFRMITKYVEEDSLKISTQKQKESHDGDSIELFGIYDEFKGGTVEGRTFDIIIRDEAHLGNDRKFRDEVVPTTYARRNCIITIGNGGYKDCDFYRQIGKGSYLDEENGFESVLIRYTYSQLKPFLIKLSEQGLSSAKIRMENIEKDIRQYGMESWEVQKNIFCRWILQIGNYVTEQQLRKCHDGSIKWSKSEPTPLYMGIDFAKSGDRTVATVMNDKREIIDWIIIKEANEEMRLRHQCEILRDYCDSKKYTPFLALIGADTTGLGIGAAEFLEHEFGNSEIAPYQFTDKHKHEWYNKGRELIITRFDSDRIKYNPRHKLASIFEKEMTELEVGTQDKRKQFLTFNAPNRQNCFDDFVASFNIVNDLRLRDIGMFSNLQTYRERTFEDDLKPPEPESRFQFFNKYFSTTKSLD